MEDGGESSFEGWWNDLPGLRGSLSIVELERYEGTNTGGQKSFCMSTTIKAEVDGLAALMMMVDVDRRSWRAKKFGQLEVDL